MFARSKMRTNMRALASNLQPASAAESIPPERFSITFRENYNIVALAALIEKRIAYDASRSDAPSKEEVRLEREIGRAQTLMAREVLKNKLRVLADARLILLSASRLEVYREGVKPLLDKYASIPLELEVIDVMNHKTYSPTEDDLERIAVIEEFLLFSSRYVSVTYYCSGKTPENIGSLCHDCFYDYSAECKGVIGMLACPSCNSVIVQRGSVYGTSHDSPGGEDRISFARTMDNYEGKISSVNLEHLSTLLDKSFQEEGRPLGAEIRARPLDEDGTKLNTSIDVLSRALSLIDNNCCSAINLVAHSYWGYALPDISEHRDVLLEDYDRIQCEWDKMSVEDRCSKSNIPSAIRLYCHLTMRGIVCKRESLNIPHSIGKYTNVFLVMWERAGFPMEHRYAL